METERPFTSTFERDHVHMTVTVAGRFERADVEPFQAALGEACRGRRREWTINAAELADSNETAFVEALAWLRATWGHVCLLNPPPRLRAAVEAAGAERTLVVRSDARAPSAGSSG